MNQIQQIDSHNATSPAIPGMFLLSLNTTPPFDVRSLSVLKRRNSGERTALVRTCIGAAAALLVVVTALTGIINKTIDY